MFCGRCDVIPTDASSRKISTGTLPCCKQNGNYCIRIRRVMIILGLSMVGCHPWTMYCSTNLYIMEAVRRTGTNAAGKDHGMAASTRGWPSIAAQRRGDAGVSRLPPIKLRNFVVWLRTGTLSLLGQNQLVPSLRC